MEQEPKTLDDLLYRCTVRIDVDGKQRGTGFFIAPGMVITCAHVVEGATGELTTQPIEIYWHWGRQHYPTQIRISDFLPKPYPDLTLLRIGEPSEHPCVYLERDDDVQPGTMLYSYGYTQEYPNGDSAYFDYEGPSHDPDFLKLKNAQASHGMSGAPLLNSRTGAVCGIIKKSRNPNSDLGGRAVPVSTILSEFPELPALQDGFHERSSTWMLLRPRNVTTDNITVTDDPSNGAVANITSPQGRVLMRSHAGPVSLPPRAEAGFLDRRSEVEVTTAVLEGGSPAEFHGPTGVGKTAMLRQLSYQEFAKSFPDGIVFFRVRQTPLEDLLLELLKAFYDLEPFYKPTPIEIRSHLQSKHALIVLDDVDLDNEQIGELMDAAPGCVFLLASTKRSLWGQGRAAVALRGLPSEDGVSLMERELEHVLSTEERSLAAQVCSALGGYPQSLLEVAGLMRDEGVSLVDVAEQMRRHTGSVAEAITERVVVALDESEKQMCAALASLGGASVGEQHLNELAGVENPQPTLESLQRRHLVQKHSPRYSLAGSLDETLQEKWDLLPWNARALGHFTAWAEDHRHAPRLILEESEALLRILERAVQEGHWERALRLGRAVESAFIFGGHWGAWAQVLAWQQEAAQSLGDIAAKAWTLHQSGTRALCLKEISAAHADLTEALHLRESLGDQDGVAVTRHNLNLLGGFSGDQGPEGSDGGPRPRPPHRWLWWIVVTIVVVAILAIVGATALGRGGWDPMSGNESPQGGDQQEGGQPSGGDQQDGEGDRPNGGGDQQDGGGGQPSDGDEDSVPDTSDNCQDTPNVLQYDADGDGVGDACEPYGDSDGVLDDTDNCLFTPNRAQEDFDNDGIGDACDTPADITPPTLTLPDDIVIYIGDDVLGPVSYTVSATDDVDGPVEVSCSPPSGATFDYGTTTVYCSATDSAGNKAEDSFNVTVTYQPSVTTP